MRSKGPSSGHSLTKADVTPDMIESFKSRLRKTDDCWIWTGARLNGGHGVLRSKGRNFLVHRIAYVLTYGDLSPGLVVMHTCGSPACVRPEHLTSDATKRGNARRAAPAYVDQIRRSYQRGYEYWEIAPTFKSQLTPLQVRKIALNGAWRDPTYEPREQRRRKPSRRRRLDGRSIAEMRKRFVKGSRRDGVAAIAREHGVSSSTAWEAINGRSSHSERL